jgi:hypothetical protein
MSRRNERTRTSIAGGGRDDVPVPSGMVRSREVMSPGARVRFAAEEVLDAGALAALEVAHRDRHAGRTRGCRHVVGHHAGDLAGHLDGLFVGELEDEQHPRAGRQRQIGAHEERVVREIADPGLLELTTGRELDPDHDLGRSACGHPDGFGAPRGAVGRVTCRLGGAWSAGGSASRGMTFDGGAGGCGCRPRSANLMLRNGRLLP